MIVLLNGGLDKPLAHLATPGNRAPMALSSESKAGSNQLSRARLFRSTCDLISRAMPTLLESRILEVIRE